jgi:hypothetical protein
MYQRPELGPRFGPTLYMYNFCSGAGRPPRAGAGSIRMAGRGRRCWTSWCSRGGDQARAVPFTPPPALICDAWSMNDGLLAVAMAVLLQWVRQSEAVERDGAPSPRPGRAASCC